MELKVNSPIIIGWREWVALPELGIERLKAKIDTGARTSALHAFKVDAIREHGCSKVQFAIHHTRQSKKVWRCTADLKDIRWVMDSGGRREQRCVIMTPIILGNGCWPIEITLTRRDNMRFRMLLGRTALQGNFLVDISSSYLLGK